METIYRTIKDMLKTVDIEFNRNYFNFNKEITIDLVTIRNEWVSFEEVKNQTSD